MADDEAKKDPKATKGKKEKEAEADKSARPEGRLSRLRFSKKKDMPGGLWLKCESCSDVIFRNLRNKVAWSMPASSAALVRLPSVRASRRSMYFRSNCSFASWYGRLNKSPAVWSHRSLSRNGSFNSCESASMTARSTKLRSSRMLPG